VFSRHLLELVVQGTGVVHEQEKVLCLVDQLLSIIGKGPCQTEDGCLTTSIQGRAHCVCSDWQAPGMCTCSFLACQQHKLPLLLPLSRTVWMAPLAIQLLLIDMASQHLQGFCCINHKPTCRARDIWCHWCWHGHADRAQHECPATQHTH
jgi:hypothetical protein